MSSVTKTRLSGKQHSVAGHPPDAMRYLVLFLAVLLAVRLTFMAWLPLTDTTEARYAEIARKMLETGDWITPQFDYGVPFWGKPPLHTWLAASGMGILGVTAFAARLPILLVSMAVLGVIFQTVRVSDTNRTAMLAVVICSSSVLFFGAAAFVMTDMVMVLGTTLSMCGFYIAVRGQSHDAAWGYLFFVGLAIGLLAKGPTALVLTVLPCGCWIVLQNRWKDLVFLPWKSGLTLTAILALPWYIAAEISTPGFLRYFLMGEHFERFVVPGWQGDLYGSGHQEPLGMIWLFAFGMMLPWTPLAMVIALHRRPIPQADQRDWNRYLCLWIISPLVLFTPAANILPAYVLPVIPSFSILLARMINEDWPDLRWLRWAVAVCFALALCVFLTITIAARFSPAIVGLRSAEQLVEGARYQDPGGEIFVYPARSYSVEFYTAGRSRTITSTKDLAALASNTTRDAVIAPNTGVAAVRKALGPRFMAIQSDHRHHLFLERSP